MAGLIDNTKLIVGFDLTDEYAQVSFLSSENTVESVSFVTGAEEFNIPTVLCKRADVNQWYYGREALEYSRENNVPLIQNLLSKAVSGEKTIIEEREFDSVALLTLFVKRTLGIISLVSSPEKISALMITCRELNHETLSVLKAVVAGLKLKSDNVCFQSHTESFYSYMIHQPEELWLNSVLLLDYGYDTIESFTMECNKHTRPIVVFVDRREYPFPSYEPMPKSEELKAEKLSRLDESFCELIPQITGISNISAVYLLGENFTEEWMKDSLKLLCRGRRVFQGNNLYCKGACYGMLEKINKSEAGETHVFLGNDKLKANVGMNLLKNGKKSYLALLDAGVNWFEASKEVDVYISDGETLELTISPLLGQKVHYEEITLEGVSLQLTRLRINVSMSGEKTMNIVITDLGLGSFRESSGNKWENTFELY